MPILARHEGLLVYPSQDEGEEQSSHVIYIGAIPAQEVLPAVVYLIGLGRRRFFLLDTDYIYPRSTNTIIQNYLAACGIGGNVVAERYAELYIGFGEGNWRDIMRRIRKLAGRDGVILATPPGDAKFTSSASARGNGWMPKSCRSRACRWAKPRCRPWPNEN